jgi:hypothetical protein
VRWVHVAADGTEVDYASPPPDGLTIKVTLGKARKSDRTILEETIMTGPWSPPGRGWELVSSGRGKSWRWQRRRKRISHRAEPVYLCLVIQGRRPRHNQGKP